MSEPSLREFQRWMKSRIRQANPPAAAADSPLNPQRGISGDERMRVYAGGYAARIREALAEAFEAVHHVLGQEFFTELAESYAARFPSHDYNLSLTGRHLPAFLKEWPKTEDLPFLPDLAQLEWLVCLAFHAFDEAPMNPQAAASIAMESWENSRLMFQSSVGVIASAWPILDLWQARTQPRERIDIPLIERPQHVLVYRDKLQVRCACIDSAQCQLLRRLLNGQTLGEVCGTLASTGEAPPLAEWFSQWMRLGLIVRCEAKR